MSRAHTGVARGSTFIVTALLCFELLALSVSNELLIPSVSNGSLRVSAPRLHFLSGKSLQKLRDGMAVPFDFQLSVALGSKTNVAGRSLERLVVSYDLWEEKFTVVRPAPVLQTQRNLSLQAAEAWCMSQMAIPIASLPANEQMWARLEIRTVNQKIDSTVPEHGISIATLIDIFSRPIHPDQEHWALEYGPFRISDLLKVRR